MHFQKMKLTKECCFVNKANLKQFESCVKNAKINRHKEINKIKY